VPFGSQPPGKMPANETGSTSDCDSHAFPPDYVGSPTNETSAYRPL